MAKTPTQTPFRPDPVPPPAAPRTTFDRAFALDVLVDAGFPQSDAEALLTPLELKMQPGVIQRMADEPLELSRDEIAVRFAAGRAAHPSVLSGPMDDNSLRVIAVDALRFAATFLHIRQLKDFK